MNQDRFSQALRFYLLTIKLKDLVRTGWKIWNVKRERLESVAEHIYGTCMLAIALDSELDMKVDMQKVIMMCVLHELEEIRIGDLTHFDNVTDEEKSQMGRIAVEELLSGLVKGDDYLRLIEEFEAQETREAMFIKMVDKLEASIQMKVYEEEGAAELYRSENRQLFEDARIKKRIETEGAKTISDLFIERNRNAYIFSEINELADYLKGHELGEVE